MDVAQLGADVLKELEARGWKIQRSSSSEPLLPAEVSRRYPRIPVELIDSFKSVALVSHPPSNHVEPPPPIRRGSDPLATPGLEENKRKPGLSISQW
jgi:hypothetical protein